MHRLTRALHIRNARLVLLAQVPSIGLCCYTAWAFYVAALSGELGVVDQIWTSPLDVWDVIVSLNETGYKINSGQVSGVILWVFWGLEAAVLVGSAIVSNADQLPYSELAKRWTVEQKELLRLQATLEQDEVATRLVSGDASVLADMPLAEPGPGMFYQVTLYLCPAGGAENYLTVRQESVTVDKKGNETRNLTRVVENMRVDRAWVEALMAPA